MKIKNQKLLKRIMEVSVATGLVVTTLSGCATNISKEETTQTEKQTQEEDSSFVTYQDLIDYKYYIICIDDISYDEKVYITKIPSFSTIEDLGDGRYIYYYKEASIDPSESTIMGSFVYDRYSHTFAKRLGPDVLYSIPLTDYLDYYDLQKENYTKKEWEVLYQQVREDYKENNFKELNKEKVKIKEN